MSLATLRYVLSIGKKQNEDVLTEVEGEGAGLRDRRSTSSKCSRGVAMRARGFGVTKRRRLPRPRLTSTFPVAAMGKPHRPVSISIFFYYRLTHIHPQVASNPKPLRRIALRAGTGVGRCGPAVRARPLDFIISNRTHTGLSSGGHPFDDRRGHRAHADRISKRSGRQPGLITPPHPTENAPRSLTPMVRPCGSPSPSPARLFVTQVTRRTRPHRRLSAAPFFFFFIS
jgi:hypothetical protein